MSNTFEKIDASIAQMGDVQLTGIRLEDADSSLLDPTRGSLDQHVAMQPSAMAFYLSLKSQAKRRLDNAKNAYERWERRQYALARAAVESGTTRSAIRVEDVKARFVVDNEPEIEKWEARIEKAQAEYDTMDAWCEGWKQKSFSLREYTGMAMDDQRMSPSVTRGGDTGRRWSSTSDRGQVLEKVRSIMAARSKQVQSTRR